MECRLDGRVALITGGSKGLGLAMAKLYAQSGSGSSAVIRYCFPSKRVSILSLGQQ